MKQTMWLSEFSSLSEYTRLYHISRWHLREEKINLIGLELAIDPPPPPGGILYTMIFWNYII